MKPFIIRCLLGLLNSRFLNGTPCRYGFIGNVDAFSYEHLQSEERQRPGIDVKTILSEADRFKSCPLNTAVLTVIDGKESREATAWDLHELRTSLLPKKKTGDSDDRSI